MTELVDPSKLYVAGVAHMRRNVVVYERTFDQHGNVTGEWVTDGTDVELNPQETTQ